ncbi:hypothetical protein BH23BAC1_BH23BAC1_17960 [soil metagenome]
MDTDDLSREAYDAVIIEAEKLTHDLTINFGVLSSSCKNEDEYLEKSKQLAQEIKDFDDFELEDIFFGNVPEKGKLINTLNKILSNIDEVNKIPIEKRHYDF